MDAIEARRALTRLRDVRAKYERAGQPLTVRRAAHELALPRSTLHDLVGQWHRRPRRIGKATKAKLDELLRQDVSTREISRRLGIGHGTIDRRREALRSQVGSLVRCEKWRCPIGGELLQVNYCLEHQTPRPLPPDVSNSPDSGALG